MPRWLMILLAVAIYVPIMMLIGWVARPVVEVAVESAASIVGIWTVLAAGIAFIVWALWPERWKRHRDSKP